MVYMFNTKDADEEAHLSSCICGYHIYNVIWNETETVEEELPRQLENAKVKYTISVLQGLGVVGHLTQKISRINTSSNINIT